MKPIKYFYEVSFLIIISGIIYFFNTMAPKNMYAHFGNVTQSDFSLSTTDFNPAAQPVLNLHQYYRVMDSTNIAKLSFYNFQIHEKIEVINANQKLGWAFVKIESRKGKLIPNAYTFILIKNLHAHLPNIHEV